MMRPVFFSVLGGLLLGIGFVVPIVWTLVFFGFIPLLYALSEARSDAHAFGLGWCSGFALYGCAIFGIFWFTLPLDWLGVFPLWFQIVLVGISWSLTSSGLALSVGLFAVVVRRLSSDSWHDVFIVPAAWVLCEWLAMWEFSIQNAGNGSILGAHFGLGQLGNLVAHDDVLLQLASLGGVYILSALVPIVGVLLYRLRCTHGSERRAIVNVIAIVVVVWVMGYAFLERTPSAPAGALGVRVALVSTQEPPIFHPSADDAKKSFETVKTILPRGEGSDIVVLPESTEFLNYYRAVDGPLFAQHVAELLGTSSPILIDSDTIQVVGGSLESQLELYDPTTRESIKSYKYFLLPDGEYVPSMYNVLIPLLGQGAALKAVAQYRTFEHALAPAPLFVRNTSLGVLFCNETMSPTLYASLALHGASVFINVAAHSWFHGSRVVAEQMLEAAKIRAVESRRWYAQATDVAPSFVLDPYGRVATSSAWGSVGLVNAVVYPRTDSTPYSAFPLWPLILCTVLILARFGRGRRREKMDA